LELPFCLRLFYINWPSSTPFTDMKKFRVLARRGAKKISHRIKWKVQCEKKWLQSIIHVEHRSNINQFPFFIFTLLRALFGAVRPATTAPYPYGTRQRIKKWRWVRRGYHHPDSRHILIGLQNLSFLTAGDGGWGRCNGTQKNNTTTRESMLKLNQKCAYEMQVNFFTLSRVFCCHASILLWFYLRRAQSEFFWFFGEIFLI
jgi:hypothetical protein